MQTDMPQIKRLFMLFHGMYGNQLLDKFRTNQLNDQGEDLGLLSAQAVWLNGLREFDFEIIRKAVAKCELKHKTFPPTLPEFRDLCRSLRPTDWNRAAAPKQLPISPEMQKVYREKNRALLRQMKLQQAGQYFRFGDGLQSLMTMVAKAAGDAGGDEVATLLKLEAQFKASAA